jgi:hypothetical protein
VQEIVRDEEIIEEVTINHKPVALWVFLVCTLMNLPMWLALCYVTSRYQQLRRKENARDFDRIPDESNRARVAQNQNESGAAMAE